MFSQGKVVGAQYLGDIVDVARVYAPLHGTRIVKYRGQSGCQIGSCLDGERFNALLWLH
tara:strand:+ start:429 stop:605 length:177 start_codon:yes stop_codon:yes gene_type:complete